MTTLRYLALAVGTTSTVLLAVGVVWYVIRHKPLFIIIQSRFITLDVRFLTLNLCILILVILAYKLSFRGSH